MTEHLLADKFLKYVKRVNPILCNLPMSARISGGSFICFSKNLNLNDIDVYVDHRHFVLLKKDFYYVDKKQQTKHLLQFSQEHTIQIINRGIYNPSNFDLTCCQYEIDLYSHRLLAAVPHWSTERSKINWAWATNETKLRFLKYRKRNVTFDKADESRMWHCIKNNLDLGCGMLYED